MNTDPAIVKTLREEERLGTLQNHATHDDDVRISNTLTEQKEYAPTNTQDYSSYGPKTTFIDLVSTEEKYKVIFENYSVAITLADNEGRIISWNKYT